MLDFKAKMHQFQFRLGLRPRPRLQRSPDLLAGFKGGLLLRNGRGRGGKGKGKGKEGTPKVWLTPPMFEILKNTLTAYDV